MSARKQVTASAPGKVIVCGEYAVLEGWPALVLAVDRRLKLHLQRDASEGLSVRCPGLDDKQHTLNWDTQSKLVTDSAALDMFVATLNHFLEVHGAQSDFRAFLSRHSDYPSAQGWQFVCDSRALFESGNKLGLGSSAAMTVAISALIHHILAEQSSSFQALSGEALWLLAQNLHSRAQGKRGSGVDLAASIAGGVQRFVNQADRHGQMQPRSLPQGLHFRFVWTGSSASTPAFLNSLSAWKSHQPQRFKNEIRGLGEASEAVCAATDADNFLRALSGFTRALKRFDESSALGIFAPIHQSLYHESRQFDRVIYKPCGAGGGDLGMAISDDLDRLNAFVGKHVNGTRADVVNLNIDPQGLVVAAS